MHYARLPESLNKWTFLFYMAIESIRSIPFFVDAILIYERIGPCTTAIFNTPDAIHNNAIEMLVLISPRTYTFIHTYLIRNHVRTGWSWFSRALVSPQKVKEQENIKRIYRHPVFLRESSKRELEHTSRRHESKSATDCIEFAYRQIEESCTRVFDISSEMVWSDSCWNPHYRFIFYSNCIEPHDIRSH